MTIATSSTRSRSAAALLVSACRPRQWIKNGLVLIPLMSSGSFRSAEAIERSAAAMVAFTMMASAVYLLNDIADAAFDGAHPEKRARAIASGALSKTVAAVAGVVLGAGALAIGVVLGWKVALVLGIYAAVNAGYSAGLRREPVLDVLLVSSGFVLRPMAGAYAIPVRVSAWLFVVSLLLSLTLALLKRRSELVQLEGDAVRFRPALGGYSVRFLDQLISILAGAGIVSYALYTFQSEHGEALVATLPVFLYAVFRYLYLVYERGAGAAPEEIFLRDRPMQIAGLVYLAVVGAIVYLQ